MGGWIHQNVTFWTFALKSSDFRGSSPKTENISSFNIQQFLDYTFILQSGAVKR